MSAKGVSTIIKQLKPHIQCYFDDLIDRGNVKEEPCHQSYEYPTAVVNQNYCSHFGIFFDYLIRREIHVLLKTEAVDNRAEMLKSALGKYDQKISQGERPNMIHVVRDGICIPTSSSNIGKLRKFLASYKNFKDITNRSVDILEDIFNTSMLHMMSYGRLSFLYCPEFINPYNVKDVLKYVRTWNLKKIKINPTVSGKLFFGDADLIFHDSIMDMKVSKDRSLYRRVIYQMIFYALGLFIKNGQQMRKFKVYNPLLGVMYVVDLPYLDFDELRQEVDDEPCWVSE